MKNVLLRISHLEIARGFHTWRTIAETRARNLSTVHAVVCKLANPRLQQSWSTWQAWHAEHVHAMRGLATAVYHLRCRESLGAWRAWREAYAESKRAARIVQIARVAAGRLATREISHALGTWHQQMLLAQVNHSSCTAHRCQRGCPSLPSGVWRVPSCRMERT